jgi:hypothetical protein
VDPAPPADDGALEALLRERRYGPPDPDDATPWDFVRRWPDDVVRGRAWPIISRLLTDGDELVRARAVELVRVWSEGSELTKARVLEVAQQHPDLYGDQAPEGVSLRNELAFALSNGVDEKNGARVAAVLKQMAAHGPIGGGAASVLGRYEPDFVAAQAQRWGDGQVSWIVEATRSLALFRRDAILPFLQAVRGLGQASRQRILEAVEDYIKWDDAVAIALAQGQRLPPPRKPAPSVDECKNAIGL